MQRRQDGAWRTPQIQRFRATWRPAGGASGVVQGRQEPGWLALFSTAVPLTAAERLSAAADRLGSEPTLHGLQEGAGVGPPQVRDSWAHGGLPPQRLGAGAACGVGVGAAAGGAR